MTAEVCIAIVCDTVYGHTGGLVRAIKFGVEQFEGVTALLLTVEEAQTRWDSLSAVEAIIFGALTYMSATSARFKAFQDAISNAVVAKGYL